MELDDYKKLSCSNKGLHWVKHVGEKAFTGTWCTLYFMSLVLSGILGLKDLTLIKKRAFWRGNCAPVIWTLSSMYPLWIAVNSLQAKQGHLFTPFSLNTALSWVESNKAAITNRDTKTFNWQLPITHPLITAHLPITLSSLLSSFALTFFRWWDSEAELRQRSNFRSGLLRIKKKNNNKREPKQQKTTVSGQTRRAEQRVLPKEPGWQ